MRFGRFLVERGRVAPHDVQRALELQRQREVNIAEIALRERILTERQVLEIIDYQGDTTERFGEVGRQLGHLSPPQLDALVALQRKTRPPIGQLLAEMGAIDHEALIDELGRFHRRDCVWSAEEVTTRSDIRVLKGAPG